MTPYHHFVAELARLVREGRQFPLGGFADAARPVIAADAPRALIFSPHPDDECIIGGLALRLQREAGLRVVNVAVTQGSNKARQAARWDELRAACDYLGFDLVATVPGGLETRERRGREPPIRRTGRVGRRDRAHPRRASAGDRVLSARCRLEQLAHRHAPSARRCAGAPGAGVHLPRRRNRVLGRDGDAEPDGGIERRRILAT